jgi:hypothetical protein
MHPPPDIHTLSQREVQVLADRLFSRGISNLTTVGPQERADTIAASRALRALMRHYEMTTGRQVQTVLLCGRV